MERKRYLITGGTGFIGSALVRRLVEKGHQVTVLDNDIRGAASRLEDIRNNIVLRQVDIRDSRQVSEACKDVDSVIHLAYINGTEYFYSKPELVLEVGVKGMMNVIDACLENEIKELVLASSSEVYQSPSRVPTDETAPLVVPDPLNPRYSYGAGKIISEMLALNYGRRRIERVMVFRPHNVYGPDMGWEHVIPQFSLRMKELTEKQPEGTLEFPIQGTGEETRAFIFIDDFVDGLMDVLTKGEHMNIYHIGSAEEISIKGLAQRVAECFDREIKIIQGERAKGGTKRRCPDITKLKRLGFEPSIPLGEGLKRTVDWYKKNADKIQKLE